MTPKRGVGTSTHRVAKRWFRSLLWAVSDRLERYLEDTEYEDWSGPSHPMDDCLTCRTIAFYIPMLEKSIFEARPILWQFEKETDPL